MRILLAALIAAMAYPAREIRQQFEKRRRIETNYRQIKRDMPGSEPTLRSGTAETVHQEIWRPCCPLVGSK